MGSFKPVEFYNGFFRNEPRPTYTPPWGSSYRSKRLLDVVRRIPRDHNVLDLGCGPADMAAMCWFERKHQGIYVGVDFSPVCIELATTGNRVAHQRSKFVTSSIHNPADLLHAHLSTAHDCTIVCCETLEHLECDTEPLANSPSGVPWIITVPEFDAPAHVHVFKSQDQVQRRYGPYFDHCHIEFTDYDRPGFGIYTLIGVTR